MNNNELLLAISDMMDQKLKNLEEGLIPRVKNLENSLNDNVIPKITNIELRMENELLPRMTNIELRMENELLPRMTNIELRMENELLPRMTNIELRIENDLIPRISHMEDCYISTYERSQNGIDQLDEIQRDIEVIKTTVTGHSNELNKFTNLYLIK